MPTVPTVDVVAFLPSGIDAFGLRLPRLATMIPRRAKPIPRMR